VAGLQLPLQQPLLMCPTSNAGRCVIELQLQASINVTEYSSAANVIELQLQASTTVTEYGSAAKTSRY